jgi:hypothetical protein
MNVKDAVKTAINYVIELFSQEELTNVGLEEVIFDENEKCWQVTVGFSRPWDYHPDAVFKGLAPNALPSRQYKVVQVTESGEVKAVKIRE